MNLRLLRQKNIMPPEEEDDPSGESDTNDDPRSSPSSSVSTEDDEEDNLPTGVSTGFPTVSNPQDDEDEDTGDDKGGETPNPTPPSPEDEAEDDLGSDKPSYNPLEDSDIEPPDPVSAANSDTFASTLSRFKQQQRGPANQKFSDFLNQPVPTRDQLPGTRLNRLAAILGGASEGFQHGAGAGAKTAAEILNQPMADAMDKYNLQAKVLQTNAQLEDKDQSRQEALAKQQLQERHQRATEAQAAADLKARQDHWDSQSKAANEAAAAKGWDHSVNATDGHLYYHKVMPDGTIKTLDGGKVGETIPEKTQRQLTEFTNKNAVTVKGEQQVEGTRQADREKNIKTENDNRAAAALLAEGTKEAAKNKEYAAQQQLIKDRAAAQKDARSQPRVTTQTTTPGDKGATTRVTTTGPASTPDDKNVVDATTVPAEKRVVNQVYRLKDGTTGVWTGQGFK